MRIVRYWPDSNRYIPKIHIALMPGLNYHRIVSNPTYFIWDKLPDAQANPLTVEGYGRYAPLEKDYKDHDDVIKWKKNSALLAICAGNSPVTGEFTAQRPVTRSFDVFFDLHLHKRLSKQSWGWWFETPSRPLWRHCNVIRLGSLTNRDYVDQNWTTFP